MSDIDTSPIGRNEPCPCGSGKKYKRCCGKDAAPKLPAPAWPPAGASAQDGASAFDPSQMDPAMMSQMAQMLQRLPRGQMQRLQALVQKAMAGKDVTREAQELERMLPPEFKKMAEGFQMPGGMAALGAGAPSGAGESPAPTEDMSVDDAKAIVAQALAEGKISPEQAQQLLGAAEEGTPSEALGSAAEQDDAKESKFGKLWRSMKGK